MRKFHRPPPQELPEPTSRRFTGGVPRDSLELRLETTTPILGGGTRTRDVDHVDIIRPPSIRGALRFWWRALFAVDYNTSEALFRAERELWGGLGSGPEEVTRSLVDVSVDVEHEGDIDRRAIVLIPRRGEERTQGSYALWAAQENNDQDQAPRRHPGVRFVLRLDFPETHREAVVQALRAYVLFGGYGGRTRRGCGSLTVSGAARSEWLPAPETFAEDIRRMLPAMFGVESERRDVPSLSGSRLLVGKKSGEDCVRVWDDALQWLFEFRQGRGVGREPGQGQVPGRSRWPEADKVRHLSPAPGQGWTSEPRHNKTPVWPRAGFGLPIVTQSQRADIIPSFTLTWRRDGKSRNEDRLASPLIIKAMSMSDGSFRPIALWMRRSYPEGQVVMEGREEQSGAAFDDLIAPGDQAFISALQHGQENGEEHGRLCEAFCHWLCHRTEEVTG